MAFCTADDHNRIVLNALEGCADCQREFINACYIDVGINFHKYIYSPLPLPSLLTSLLYSQGYSKTCKFVVTQGISEVLASAIVIITLVYRSQATPTD